LFFFFFPDIGISNTTITNTSWKLLEYFTLKQEKDNDSELHKIVAQKLLQDGAFLPQWLLISYKVKNETVMSIKVMSILHVLVIFHTYINYHNYIYL